MRNPPYEISEYLLKHGDVLRSDILENFMDCNTFLGKIAYATFKDEIINEFIEELQREIAIDLRLNLDVVEDIINKKFIETLLGGEYLELNR